MNYLHSDFPIIFVFLLSHTSLDWSQPGGTWNHSYYYSQRERETATLFHFPIILELGLTKHNSHLSVHHGCVCAIIWQRVTKFLPLQSERERATFFHFPNMGILGLDLSKHNWHLCPPWVCVCARILPNYLIAVSKLPNCFPILPQFEFCLNFNLLQFGFCPNLDFVSIWFLH